MFSKFFKLFKKKPPTLSGDPNLRIMEVILSNDVVKYQVEKYEGVNGWLVCASCSNFKDAHDYFLEHKSPPPEPSIVSKKEVPVWPRPPSNITG